jgi:peptidoglycan/xylan/chitin deacetylase (PgdA/CDA1 family)
MTINLTVMMYHYVRDAGDAADAGSGIPGLSTAKFAAQVQQLAREHEMVGWEDVRAAIVGEQPLAENACLLTFDDGLCDHYLNVFPILEREKIAGLFFAIARQNDLLPMPFKLHYLVAHFGLHSLRDRIWDKLTEPQRRIYCDAEARYRLRWSSETDVIKGIYQRDLEPVVSPLLSELTESSLAPERELARQLLLDESQMREMRAGGMNFGGHSASHPWFDFIDAARRDSEIRASSENLAGFETAPFAFAYPYGGLANDAPGMLEREGFRAAFTTRSQTMHPDEFYIGRYDGEEWDG